MRRADSSRYARLLLAPFLAAAVIALAAPYAATAGDHPTKNEDPWIGLNRPIFRFNDALDRYALEPVAKGYDYVLPDLMKGWVTNFFNNLWFPITFTNCVLQGKPHEATQSLARFMINTTAGLGGFGDPASRLHVPTPYEDFGQTLGYWGVGAGPYLMLPLFGPSDIRDTFGRVADSATRVWPFYVDWWVSAPAGVVEVVNTRARYLKNVKDLRESSVDYYAAVRDAYLRRREALIADRIGSSEVQRSQEVDEDLYFPTDDQEAPK